MLKNNLIYEFSYRKFETGNYILFYNILSTYDWSSAYETSSAVVAIVSLSVAFGGAME
jgi:hypothetical protein